MTALAKTGKVANLTKKKISFSFVAGGNSNSIGESQVTWQGVAATDYTPTVKFIHSKDFFATLYKDSLNTTDHL
ncbi:MAG: hypothetical protein PF495_13220 [Spirochaetales bacterium]|jgi:hypothetical protein|nr:hypothetical protein [Spirochaetales bacterium]